MGFNFIIIISLGLMFWFNILVYLGLNISKIHQLGQSSSSPTSIIYQKLKKHPLRVVLLSQLVTILISGLFSLIYYIVRWTSSVDQGTYTTNYVYIMCTISTIMTGFFVLYRFNFVINRWSFSILFFVTSIIFGLILPLMLG
jgi:hypothetical protein